jgi:DNA-binding PadR family transcriptional regulator
MVLQAIHSGCIYGFGVKQVTGLPSGTVYLAMRRLERDGLILSQWEKQPFADAEHRSVRRYYRLTRASRATLEASRARNPLLAKLTPTTEVEYRWRFADGSIRLPQISPSSGSPLVW